ncbi:MAG: response regulator [Polyangiaceae bacterium]|nr:response regulator [Myxococcales bacterium]MCB9587911.1 response regulator [Polyangiaceae bacterium]MCB9608860.1 response regulator [Polyangiaceae bacterium]
MTRAAEILLVEDSPTDRLLAIAALEESKVLNSLHCVENGVDALGFLRKEGRFADVPTPDLILLDLNLPKMDGREVLLRIKADARLRQIPVVVLTTSESEEDIARAYDSNANSYITKPIDIEQFVRALRTLGDYWFQVVTLPAEGRRVAEPIPRSWPTEETKRVLLLEDNPGDAVLASTALEDVTAFGPFAVEHVSRLSEAIEALGRHAYSAVISDVNLPDSEGADTWRVLRGLAPTTTLVVLTGNDSESVGRAALADGVDDYLPKNQVFALPRVVSYSVERRLSQERQFHSQRLESVGRLAGGVAHDFNNLLTIIQGNAALIETSGSKEETLEATSEILAAASRGAKLSRQLLAYSRKQMMSRSAVDLNRVVEETMRMLARVMTNVKVTVAASDQAISLFADRTMLEQVIVNLAVNARDALGGRPGEVRISTSVAVVDTPVPDHFPKESYPGTFAQLSVSDTGCGIPASLLASIWEPYVTTKPQGSGLGLSTVYGIVSQHQGWIVVDSTAGEGTTFSVFVPMHEGPPESCRTSSSVSASPATTGGRVLIVDDERGVRRSNRRILEREGYSVLEAADGEEALLLVEHTPVDLVLTDITLPNCLQGAALGAELNHSHPELAVVYCSGFSRGVLEMDLREGENFISKPFTAGQLLAVVRARLRRQ